LGGAFFYCGRTVQLKHLWSNTTVEYDYAAYFSRYYRHQIQSLYKDVQRKVNIDEKKGFSHTIVVLLVYIDFVTRKFHEYVRKLCVHLETKKKNQGDDKATLGHNKTFDTLIRHDYKNCCP
jgi:hypothetical protein